ncbi:MAG: hypothetical protein ACOC1U_05605, partial [Spirochaetota bacterium]
MCRSHQSRGRRPILLVVLGLVVLSRAAAQPAGYDPQEFDEYINFGYVGMGFERQLLTQRMLFEVATGFAGSRPHIYTQPLAARLEPDYGQRYDEKLEVIRDLELSTFHYAGNWGVPGFRVGLGLASVSMPELRLSSDNGTTYAVEFRSFDPGFELGLGEITQLRADLLLAEWIRVAYATYGTEYVVSDAALDLYPWEETPITWDGEPNGRYVGRIQEHEFRLEFDLTRSPLRGSLFDSLLRSIELAAMVGPDNVINGYGTYIEPQLPAIPFLVVGRNETFDYYYATGPMRLGILEGKYRLRTDLGFEEVEVGLNLWHLLLAAGGYGPFSSPSIDDFRRGGIPIWG